MRFFYRTLWDQHRPSHTYSARFDSAIAQPQASFVDRDLHVTIFDKAAALASALTFLALNGYEFSEDQPKFYDAMIAIANHEIDKEAVSSLFRETWIKVN